MIEQVILVDSNNNTIGEEEKIKAHQLGLLHRAFSIFVLRKNQVPEVLFQKRALAKYHSSGLWTNSCCGHPRPGETVQEAANRRLQEEIGLNLLLKEIGVFTYKANVGNNLIEHEIDHVFIGYWQGQPIIPNPEEVEQLKWYDLDKVLKEINNKPSLYTAWIGQALEIVIDYTNNTNDELWSSSHPKLDLGSIK
ncbi:MAG: isopentenyl-diphosphate Delta-isomerase [Rickettsiales bacterium]|nr:isopentenyl-diphosphate Delta-isomerase [Rickettsiales bacterium]MCA0254244.1 isopentenyl-diphosphate Delta-isomerase [Pseudomonadota bacterium]